MYRRMLSVADSDRYRPGTAWTRAYELVSTTSRVTQLSLVNMAARRPPDKGASFIWRRVDDFSLWTVGSIDSRSSILAPHHWQINGWFSFVFFAWVVPKRKCSELVRLLPAGEGRTDACRPGIDYSTTARRNRAKRIPTSLFGSFI